MCVCVGVVCAVRTDDIRKHAATDPAMSEGHQQTRGSARRRDRDVRRPEHELLSRGTWSEEARLAMVTASDGRAQTSSGGK